MFNFEMADFVPYKNKEVLSRVRGISGKDLEKHPNPDFRIRVVANPSAIWVGDMVARIMQSDRENKKCVMILPNPCPIIYETVAEVINLKRINCRNVYVFTMDEWADQDGNIAPVTFKAGFSYSQLKYFYGNIDPELRMPIGNIVYPTNENIADYSKLIAECGGGGADICYSGPGWAGHIAFIDPCMPEFACDSLEEYINMEARVITLHPLTIMQNSLHGVFGQSGDIASVPTRAATIGPLDVKNSRSRMETHGLVTGHGLSSWQRMVSRLVLHGEVTPLVPASILQLWKTDVFVSEEIAMPIELKERVGY